MAREQEQSGRTKHPPYRQEQDEGDEEGQGKTQGEMYDSGSGGGGVYEDMHDKGVQKAVSYGEDGS